MASDIGYARVHGLEMYYEVHGTGAPLMVLPGAFMTIDLLGDLVPALARHRQVIAIEFQGHGRTADINRAFSYEQFADDANPVTPRGSVSSSAHGIPYSWLPNRRDRRGWTARGPRPCRP